VILFQISFLAVPNLKVYIDVSAIGQLFWTSGSNEGSECNTKNVFGWCSSNNILLLPDMSSAKSLYWSKFGAKSADLDRNLAFQYNATAKETPGLILQTGTLKYPFICEV